MLKRLLSLFLCMVLLLSNFPVVSFAAEADALESVSETTTATIVPEVDLPENDELFAYFAERELYGYEMATFGVAAREKLNAIEKAIYDILKSRIEKVAINGGSTVFTIDPSSISNLKYTWTNTELGVSSIVDATKVENAFFAQFDMVKILNALLSDCPFDLYWYDKTGGVAPSYNGGLSGYNDGYQDIWTKATITELTFAFAVAGAYASGSNAVTTKVAKIKTAQNNAAQVVANYASKSDYGKLVAYKEYICDAVSYNHAAADNSSTPYGNPWQLIYVFDGDTSTNVVCEGYSKAFQYLCDLSNFADDTVCYSVSGQMDGGNHMWNIVTLEGKNYLVDVTNSESNTVGYDGSLFLAGASGSAAGGYTVNGISYVYHAYEQSMWGTGASSILTLASKGYTPSGGGGHTHSFDQQKVDPKYLDSEATCTEQAVYYKSCICGEAGSDTFKYGQPKGHNWQNATCTAPKTCSVCQATESSANGHSWLDATCTAPMTCSVCQATESSANGHSWLDATCTAPMTCSVCQATKGSANGHSWLDATCTMPMTCSVCQATEGSAKGHSWKDATSTTPKTCTRCGTTGGNPGAHNHNFVSGVCACGAVQISATTFPDANFRDYITSQDYGSDGLLTSEELSSVTYMDVYDYKIKDLSGIQYFTALVYLSCEKNQLKSLDVSNCTALEYIYCFENQLTSLNVSGCTALKIINCYDNQLTSLDVSKCTALETLNCGYNQLTSLNLSKCTALIELECGGNQLTSLDMSKCTGLCYLSALDNQLTSLNVSKCTELMYLDCDSNQLTSLDVSKCTDLLYLYCYDNQLKSLNVGNCTALEDLSCGYNQLTGLDVTKCTALKYLACDSNQLTGLDVTKCTVLEYLACDGNQLTSLNVSKCTPLMHLYCSNNQLTSLDLSKCTGLMSVSCAWNQLASLNISNCTNLVYLDCGDNQLKRLDVSKCSVLAHLYCNNNQLVSLDVSKCTGLEYLYCFDNSRKVSATQNRFDLSNLVADGFNISKASNWQGGTVSGNILTVTSDEVTYSYNLGNGETETFTLIIDGSCAHSWVDATCTEPKTCKLCGATEGTTIPHTYDQKKADAKYLFSEATCTEQAVYYKSCVCGEAGTETFKYGKLKDHVYDQKKADPKYLVSEATSTSPAVYKKSCVCGKAGTETFTAGGLKPQEFKDVPANAFYYDAVMWAVENGVTTGTGAGMFSPNAICTRGQVVTFLWRAAGQPEPKNTTNPFVDVKASDYFYKAVLWARENNITSGTGDGTTFEPHANCNRAQIVTFLFRAKNGQTSGQYNPFFDVPADAYYNKAVLWAVQNGITTGTGDGTTFEPNADCTRGQVITFLWRAYTK